MPVPPLTPRTAVLGVVGAVWAGATIGLAQHALSSPAPVDVPRPGHVVEAAPAQPVAVPVPRRAALTGGGSATTRVVHLPPAAAPAPAPASASPVALRAAALAPTPAATSAAPSPEPTAPASPSPEPSASTEATPTPSPTGKSAHKLR